MQKYTICTRKKGGVCRRERKVQKTDNNITHRSKKEEGVKECNVAYAKKKRLFKKPTISLDSSIDRHHISIQ
jgi:hypothetical protein